jgi:predicted transcriptional regulator
MRDAIRKRRIEAGLSCKELSAYAQVGSNYIRHLENGHGGAHLEVLERICTILDLTLQPAPKKANRSKHGSNLGHDHNCYKEGS